MIQEVLKLLAGLFRNVFLFIVFTRIELHGKRNLKFKNLNVEKLDVLKFEFKKKKPRKKREQKLKIYEFEKKLPFEPQSPSLGYISRLS